MKRKFSLFVTIVVCLLIAAGILSACNEGEKKIVSIDFADGEWQTNYYLGEVFKPCAATVTYEDGSTETVAVIPEMVKGFDTSKLGNYNIEITINGVTKVMTITVVEKGEEAHVHSMELTAAKEATCTEGGNNAYYHCSGCNKYFKDIEGEEETTVEAETIPAAGHVIVDGVCTACGELIYTEGLEYTLSSDESYYIVTGIGTASGDIIIPDTHEGLSVKEIGSAAFINCTELTSVEIPASVSKIQNGSYSVGETGAAINFEGAFFGCVNLESVTFVEGSELSGIGDFAFAYCSSLKSIDVPDTVTNIGEGAFFLSSTLTSIEIPAGVTSIGVGAFGTCSSLASVTFAEGSRLTSIGSGAFSGCSRLTSIEIPAGVTSIGGSAFYGCSSLTSIEIPAGVTSIGDYAFQGCSNLESVTFAEGSQLTSMGEGTFFGCSSLTSIHIPAGVTSIGDYAFNGCSNLESVTFAEGSRLTSIGSYAFYRCSSLTTISFAEESELTIIGSYAFQDCSSLKSIEIPAGVTSIGSDAFYGCSNLESVTFAEGSQLTSIGGYAFYFCSNLTSIEIPSRVTGIGDDAFGVCYPTIVYNYSDLEITAGSSDHGGVAYYAEVVLTEDNLAHVKDENGYVTYTDGEEVLLLGYLGSEKDIVIPEGVTRIAKYAFDGDDIVSVTLPESLTEIGDYAFEFCYTLKEVYNNSALDITAGRYEHGYVAYYVVKVHNSSESESIFDDESGFAIVDGVLYGYRGSETVIIIPDIVTSIADYAFYGNNYIISVSIPAGVTSIGESAFYKCSNLESVTFAEGSQLTSIGSDAFRDCINLKSIEIPAGVTSIEGWMFYYCSSLQSIEIPAGVTSIGFAAFSGCSNLNTVYYAGSIENWFDIEFGWNNGSNPLCNGADLYIGGELVTAVVVPESVTAIGNCQFAGCTSLTSITIHSGVTGIGSSAFEDCSSLASVTFGEGSELTSIGSDAFSDCSSLTSIEIPAGVTGIGNLAFYGCINLTSIEIPAGVTGIGTLAFFGCSSLTSIEIPAEVTSIGDWAFHACSNLESVTFAEGSQLTSIGSYAFQVCSSLETIYYNGTEEQWNAIEKGTDWDYGCGNYDVVFLGDAGAEGGEG